MTLKITYEHKSGYPVTRDMMLEVREFLSTTNFYNVLKLSSRYFVRGNYADYEFLLSEKIYLKVLIFDN